MWAGRVATGTVNVGDDIVFLPSGQEEQGQIR